MRRWAFLFLVACGGSTTQTGTTAPAESTPAVPEPCIGSTTASFLFSETTSDDIVVDESYVYAGTVKSIVRTPRAGGPAEPLYGEEFARLLAHDDAALYYLAAASSDPGLFRLDLSTKKRRKLHGWVGGLYAVLDGDGLVYADIDTLERVPTAGGEPTKLASLPPGSVVHGVVRGPDVFYIVGVDSIFSVPRAGGDANVLLSNLRGPLSLQISGDRIYFLQARHWEDPGFISSARLDGTDLQTVVTNADASSLAADETSLYYTNDTSIMKVSKTGGTPIAIATGLDGPMSVRVYGGNVYWANGVNIAMSASVRHGVMTVCK